MYTNLDVNSLSQQAQWLSVLICRHRPIDFNAEEA
jgi:hypothetical protein